MAVLRNGVNGGFSGRMGNVVGYQLNGKWIVRSLPNKSKKNKIGSLSQQQVRAKFKKVHAFIKPILPFIRVGFKCFAAENGMSAYNAAVSKNLLFALDQAGVFYPDRAIISYGELELAGEMVITAKEDGFLLSWEPSHVNGLYNTRYEAQPSDWVMMLAYNIGEGTTFFETSGARRSTGQYLLKIHNSYQSNRYHVWVAFISDNRLQISSSKYMGELLLEPGPEDR